MTSFNKMRKQLEFFLTGSLVQYAVSHQKLLRVGPRVTGIMQLMIAMCKLEMKIFRLMRNAATLPLFERILTRIPIYLPNTPQKFVVFN